MAHKPIERDTLGQSMAAIRKDLTREEVLRDASTSLAAFVATDDAARALINESSKPPRRSEYVRLGQAAADNGGTASLRLEKRRRLAQIAACDLCGELSLEEVAAALSDLAEAWLEVGLDFLQAPPGMAVIGMGKLGGHELNYASDIDLMYVSDEDLPGSTRAATTLLAELGRPSPQGQPFRMDLNLRPEGRSGALVRSVDGCIEYYARWAHPWEHQALIKAAAVAGNAAVGAEFVDRTRPLVFPSEVSGERIASIRRMKERIESHAARSLRNRRPDAADVKLGPGGIRDIEFSIQLLQLVHGGSDYLVRRRNTLEAIAALAAGGYVAEDDGIALSDAYRWLRTVEHRLQLWQERQVHRLPDRESDRTRVARSMGFADSVEMSAAAHFDAAHRRILSDVRSRFEKLFYRPMIESLSDAGGTRLSEEALRERLRVLGFRDADKAAKNLGSLVTGISRRAVLLRLLTPAMLRFLAKAPLPDVGLLAFLRLSEGLEEHPAVLGKFRDNPPGLEFLATVLGSGRVLGELLEHVPEELSTIAAHSAGSIAGAASEPKDRDRLVAEAQASLAWRGPEGRLQGLRRFKRREMVRVALADLGGELDITDVGRGLAHLADACLEAALEGVAGPFAVVGMGKLGGQELNYSSDIDVMFVHDMDTGAVTVAEGLVRAVGDVTPEGQTWRIDLGLRPEGKDGALVRSIDSCLEYYHRWAQPWEHLALTKARVVAGDHRLGQRLVEGTRSLAWPPSPPEGAIGEIRHLKARMEKERIRRGTDARLNLKLGPGGISDIEFAAQLLQLQNAHRFPALRVTGTIQALEAAKMVGVLSGDAASTLIDTYRFLTMLRNRLFFMTGQPVDVLPSKLEDLEALGVALGFSYQPLQELQEAHLRTTRRARRVAERLIYG